MMTNKARQQARWKRNKRSERARRSPYPREMPDNLIEAILAERDRRIRSELPVDPVIRPNHFFFARGSYERTVTFLANIWAADIILKAQWGTDGAKPRRVKAWLESQGVDHGYSKQSLPKMIRKARFRITELEKSYDWNGNRAMWERLDLPEVEGH